jgi:hypothetical protein
MMRTEAPKDLAGRGFVNFARTTPELPAETTVSQTTSRAPYAGSSEPTVWPGHLAPDDADLGAAHLLLTPVDIRNPLAQVEAVSRVNPRFPHVMSGSSNVLGSSGVIDALDLDQAGLGVGVVATTLIAQVATPREQSPSVFSSIDNRYSGGYIEWRGSIAFAVGTRGFREHRRGLHSLDVY